MTLDDWRARVGGPAEDGVPTTVIDDGIPVPWLFTSDDLPSDAAGVASRAGGAGAPWQIRQEHGEAARESARRAILTDLENGVTAVGLRLDAAGRLGLGPDDAGFAAEVGRDGTSVHDLDDLDEVLDGVLLDGAPVSLSAGASGIPAAALLVALWTRRGHDLTTIAGSLGIDPLGALAASGALSEAPGDGVARAARTLAEADALLGPGVTVLSIDTAPYVSAGATAVQELAIAVATGAEYLRACDDADVAPEAAASRLEFTLQADADQFLVMAKLRAMRRIWGRVLELCGVTGERATSRLAARTSARMLSTVDPWVNMLRTTTAAFAGAVAGADVITVTPFDAPRGATSDLGRRIARNTHHILMDESHLAHVTDPGAGSWYVEWLTDTLAERAWIEMQAIEAAGGMTAALTSGGIAARLEESAARQTDAIAHRHRTLTGVNAFPLLGDDEVPPGDTSVDPSFGERETDRLRARGNDAADADAGFAQLVALAAEGARLDQLSPRSPYRQAPLAVSRDGAAFEKLRTRAAEADPEPTILLACVGTIARYNAVATWARSLFEAGGIRAVASDPILDADAVSASFSPDGPPLVAVCAASDEDPALLRSVVDRARTNGAVRVYLSRASDTAASEIGADSGVADGIDVVALLTDALDTVAGGAR